MSLELWIVYATSVFLVTVIPGPSMLLALTHGMKHGAKRTMAAAMGNVSATMMQAAISLAGLGAILTLSENVFLTIKWLGAAYLIYVGVSLWRAPRVSVAAEEISENTAQIPLKKLFGQAFFVAASNPKAIIFCTAFLPQFINTGSPQAPQFLILLGTMASIAFVCFMVYALGGQKVLGTLVRGRIGHYFNKVMGGTFISAGLGLALSRR